jgi:type VI secretion system secreted protein Hcp
VLTGRKAGDRPVEFLVITLKDVVVTSYSIDATGGSYPQDTFNLGFGQIQFVYTPQNADGRPGTPVTFCFNVKANRTC